MGKARKQTFEEAMAELEAVINELESGDLPLEEALEKYERGVKALALCRQILDTAEKRIQILVKTEQGTIEAKPLDAIEAEAEEETNEQ